MLPKAKPQLPPKRGRGRPRKYLLLIAIVDKAITDAIIDIGASIGNITDIADIADIINIAIYLQDNDTADMADTTIYL